MAFGFVEESRAGPALSLSFRTHLTGQELVRLVSLVSLPREEAERELDRFVEVYTRGIASRPPSSRRVLERRLNARAAWVRSNPARRTVMILTPPPTGGQQILRHALARRWRSIAAGTVAGLVVGVVAAFGDSLHSFGDGVDDRHFAVAHACSRCARLAVEHDGHGDRAGHREVRRRPGCRG